MPGPTRRTLLLGSAAAAFLAACGGDDGDDPGGAGTTTTGAVDPDAPVLGVTFDRNSLLVSGLLQRAPFVLFEQSGGLLPSAEAPPELTFELRSSGEGDPVEEVVVARHGDDVGRAYYPLVHLFRETGLHSVATTVDGVRLETSVNVSRRDAVAVPQVGDPLPSFPTPTVDDPRGATTICTAEPTCALHATSLDAALAEGRPVAALWSTPAFCQVAICGPVLDLLLAAAPGHPDVAVVHLEVYPNEPPPDGRPPAAFTDQFGLTYEPVLFVADATGTITARLDNIYDGAELDAALAGAT